MRTTLLTLVLVAAGVLASPMDAAAAAGDAGRGAQAFGFCAACHSLKPDVNMTGPSLAGVWGRKVGSLASFERYSPALKAADVTWNEQTLDAWLKNPAQFIPHNRMTVQGIVDAQQRADLIAFLKAASSPGKERPAIVDEIAEAPTAPDLKKLPLANQVKAIRYCRDTYHVTTGAGETRDFWERNLRFKTDSSELGPSKGTPAIVGAGMQGDRASVIFTTPEEISSFIKHQCL